MSNEELVMQVQAGVDAQKNMEQLYKQNLPMIEKVARKYAGIVADDIFEDLKQEAYIVLDNAAQGYHEMCFTFLSYYLVVLDRSLQRYVNDNCFSIRIPTQQKASLAKYDDFLQEFVKTAGRYPTEGEITYLLEITSNRVKAYNERRKLLAVESMNAPIELEDGTSDRMETVSYDVEPFTTPEDVIDNLANEQIAQDLWRIVDEMPEPYNKIVRLYYQDDMTFSQVGAALHMSCENAHFKRDIALRKLRRNKTIRSMAPHIKRDVAYSKGLQGNGVGSFRNTGSSSTERIVLKHFEEYESWQHRQKQRSTGSIY